MKIALVANTSWYLYNFRYTLIKKLQGYGHQVYSFAPHDDYSHLITGHQSKYCIWNVDQTSTNIFSESRSIYDLYKLIKKFNVDFLLTYTPKGNLYGSIVCFWMKKPLIINNISGLGTLFNNQSYKTDVYISLYKILLNKSKKVFFQNTSDREIIINKHNELKINYSILPGSGVNLNYFRVSNNPLDKEFDFVLSSRLLEEKGVFDYIKAIKIVKREYPEIKFALMGEIISNRPNAVTYDEINEWEKDGLIHYIGFVSDVKYYLNKAVCFVLPSYYNEGIARSILEASAMCMPVITTNHKGCKEAVEDGITGFLCEKKNPNDLSRKMLRLIEMSEKKRKEMGKQGRKKMEKEFDEKIVINNYLNIITSISC